MQLSVLRTEEQRYLIFSGKRAVSLSQLYTQNQARCLVLVTIQPTVIHRARRVPHVRALALVLGRSFGGAACDRAELAR